MPENKLVTKTVEGLVVKSAKGTLEPIHFEPEALNEWSILVKISHCGICHSDLHLINNDWGNSVFPMIPGHEIIGTVVEKGRSVNHLEVGQRVGIGWQRSSCHSCQWCLSADENLCPKQQATCIGHPGGFASAIVADSRFALPIPEKLKSENAAPLLCGGATVFSPLLQFRVNPLWSVGVIGIGGLGHLALQFARAFGCQVTAFSSSASKEEEARHFGAHHFVSTSDKKALKNAANTIDLLLFTSSAATDFASYLPILCPKGKMCLLGAPEKGHIDVPIFDLIAARKMIFGSNIASPHVMGHMLRVAANHNIVAQTELFPMHEANRALKQLAENKIHYRAVLYNS